MNTQPTTPPAATTPPQAPAMQRQKSSHGRMDVFVQDIGASLKEASHEIHDAFEKLRDKPSKAASPVLSPVIASPVIAPAPAPAPVDAAPGLAEALPAPVYLYRADAHASFAHLPATLPVVKNGLKAIRNELTKLIASEGGYGALAADALRIIEGAIANPNAEAAIVLSDVAKLLAQMIQDMTAAGAAAPATAPAPTPVLAPAPTAPANG